MADKIKIWLKRLTPLKALSRPTWQRRSWLPFSASGSFEHCKINAAPGEALYSNVVAGRWKTKNGGRTIDLTVRGMILPDDLRVPLHREIAAVLAQIAVGWKNYICK